MNCELKDKRSEKKTNAQKCKEYRERIKLKGVRLRNDRAEDNEIKKPKTAVERSKQYRARQKIKKQIELQQKNTDRLQKKLTMTRAEYVKEYGIWKLKLKNRFIQFGLPAKDHLDAIKTKLIDSPRSTDGSQTTKGFSLVLMQEVKEVRRDKYMEVTKTQEVPESENVSHSPSRTFCEADRRLVTIKEEMKEALSPFEKYLEVTGKEKVSESEDVRLSSGRAVCEGADPQLVLFKGEVTEIFPEIYVEVTIKQEVSESEDVS